MLDFIHTHILIEWQLCLIAYITDGFFSEQQWLMYEKNIRFLIREAAWERAVKPSSSWTTVLIKNSSLSTHSFMHRYPNIESSVSRLS